MGYHVSRGQRMSSIASIDTSQYTTPYAAGFESVQARGPEAYQQEQPKNVAAEDKETPKVDLSSYYSNVQAPNLNADVQAHVTQASQNLSNAISVAVEHGMSAQDAVNIQKAKAAYESTIRVANTTFELKVD